MGLLLGDGCFRSNPPSLITPDAEIVQWVERYARRLKWPVSVYQTPGSLSNAYYFKKPKQGTSLTNSLKTLGLYGYKSPQKFIPKIYLYADRKQREALLAGLLDTDGYLHRKSYDFVTSSDRLAADVAFLAQSIELGVIQGKSHTKGKGYKRLAIYGDYKSLPLRVPHKKTFGVQPLGGKSRLDPLRDCRKIKFTLALLKTAEFT